MSSAHRFRLRTWFEYDALERRLIVWEGVGLLRSVSTHNSHLVKLDFTGTLLTLSIGTFTGAITSDGYWSCAELTAILNKSSNDDDDYELYYHCRSPTDSIELSTRIERQFDLRPIRLRLRFDPDPLRMHNVTEISERVDAWRSINAVLKVSDFAMIFDDNMPL